VEKLARQVILFFYKILLFSLFLGLLSFFSYPRTERSREMRREINRARERERERERTQSRKREGRSWWTQTEPEKRKSGEAGPPWVAGGRDFRRPGTGLQVGELGRQGRADFRRNGGAIFGGRRR
jgi:Flp pilus assembly protein TadB